MSGHTRRASIMETDDTATPTEDVLRAVSRALRGDRKGARVLVAKARNGIEARLQHDLGALWRNDAPTTAKPKIRGARLSPPQGLPPVSSLGAVEIRWPDGRKGRLVLTPAAARHRDMLDFMGVNKANMERAFDAIAHNGRAIDQLAASQGELADRLAKLQSSGDLALLRGIVEGLADLDRRVEGVKRLQNQALAAQKRSLQQRLSRQTRALASETRAAQPPEGARSHCVGAVGRLRDRRQSTGTEQYLARSESARLEFPSRSHRGAGSGEVGSVQPVGLARAVGKPRHEPGHPRKT